MIVLRAMSRRWREADVADDRRALRPAHRPSPARSLERELSKADAVAAVLWVGATLYAVFGGADFGAGFWACSPAAASAASGPAR